MIFLTLGTQLPFDRLVRAVDDWAAATGRGGDIYAQIPALGPDSYAPQQFKTVAWLDPAEHRARAAEADVIVSHAGMGTIITALSLPRPIIVMPRRSGLGEHRNDHQLATAQRFGTRPGVTVVDTAEALAGALDRVSVAEAAPLGAPLSPFAEPGLIDAVRGQIALA